MPCTGSVKSGDSTMLSCLSPRSPCCGPNAALSLMSRSAASASRLCARSRVTEAGCARSATRLPASGARSARSARSRSMPKFIELERKCVAVVKVGLARGVPQRPIGHAAGVLLDNHGEPEAQAAARVRRRQARQIDQRVKVELALARLDRDLRIENLIYKRRALAVAGECIGRPFAGGRKVELMVAVLAGGAHEHLAAGAPPELPADARRRRRRNVHARDISMERIVQRQLAI